MHPVFARSYRNACHDGHDVGNVLAKVLGEELPVEQNTYSSKLVDFKRARCAETRIVCMLVLVVAISNWSVCACTTAAVAGWVITNIAQKGTSSYTIGNVTRKYSWPSVVSSHRNSEQASNKLMLNAPLVLHPVDTTNLVEHTVRNSGRATFTVK